jgi:extracellular factor (EF) 3-hydroxypalmitic acid methyl ester biosynthesis protein
MSPLLLDRATRGFLLRGRCSQQPSSQQNVLGAAVTEAEVCILVRQAAEKLLRVLTQAAGAAENSQSAPADEIYPLIATGITTCLRELGGTGLVGLDNRLPSSELWNSVGEILCRGWLQNRARTKPRGYAGDFEILAAIFENRRCGDPLGRHFDRYFQEESAPQAVRNRMCQMRDEIVAAARSHQAAERLQIAVVGSAFGLEIREALAMLDPDTRRRLKVVLLDLDPAALDFARQTLDPWLVPGQLQAITVNVFRLAARPSLAAPLAKTHRLYCPGLFDYLDEDQAVSMLDLFWSCLAPAGEMAVFQFAPHNPSRAYMEWLGNWYLIYRDAPSFGRLATKSTIPAGCVSMGAEALGIDLWLKARRQ